MGFSNSLSGLARYTGYLQPSEEREPSIYEEQVLRYCGGRALAPSEWKVRIAQEMKLKTMANNPWSAKALGMGQSGRVCKLKNKFKLQT